MKSTLSQPNTTRHATVLARSYAAPLLAVAATAVAILAAPLSHAATNCTSNGTETVCRAPGNTQVTPHQPPIQYHPYGDLAGPPVQD